MRDSETDWSSIIGLDLSSSQTGQPSTLDFMKLMSTAIAEHTAHTSRSQLLSVVSISCSHDHSNENCISSEYDPFSHEVILNGLIEWFSLDG